MDWFFIALIMYVAWRISERRKRRRPYRYATYREIFKRMPQSRP